MTKKDKLTPEDFGHVHENLVDAATLSGDIRDVLLSHMRSMTVPWAMLHEREQAEKIEAADKAAKDLVRRTVQAVAQRGFPHVEVQLGKAAFDKQLEMKVVGAATLDNVSKVASHGKMGAVLVLAEAADYFGERAPAKPDKDQKPFPGMDEGGE